MKHKAAIILIMMQLLSCVPANSASIQDAQSSPTAGAEATSIVQEDIKTGEAVIIYQRSGGFAGISESWAFYPDGRVISNDGSEFRLSAEQISLLLTEIEDLGFFEMSGSSSLFSDCRDCFNHQVSVRSGDRVNKINITDGATDSADKIWEVVKLISDTLNDLLD
jgi:hypothetical protein